MRIQGVFLVRYLYWNMTEMRRNEAFVAAFFTAAVRAFEI